MRSLLRRVQRRLLTPNARELLRRQRGRWRGGPTFVLSFDVETRADCLALPALVSELRDLELVCSFACIGRWVEEYPAEHAELLAAGHELLNHTDSHPSHDEIGTPARFDELATEAIRAEIERANVKLRGLGAAVTGFRAPHFSAQHTSRAYGPIHAAGLRYSSSTVASRTPHGGAPYRVAHVTEFPLTTCPRHPPDLLDSWHCSTAPDARHHDASELVHLFSELLAWLREFGGYASVYWDPRVVDGYAGYREVLRLIAAARDWLRVTTYAALVEELEPWLA